MAGSEKTRKTEEIQELVKQLKAARPTEAEEIVTQIKKLTEELIQEDVSSESEKTGRGR